MRPGSMFIGGEPYMAVSHTKVARARHTRLRRYTGSRGRMRERSRQPAYAPQALTPLPEPMLAKSGPLPQGGYGYEVKWDGFRALVSTVVVRTIMGNVVPGDFMAYPPFGWT